MKCIEKHTHRYEGNHLIVTLQHVIPRQLGWPAVVEFQMTAFRPVQYLLPDMQLNMVVLMEQGHGKLRLTIVMTTYKLTFSMSMLSVLQLLKEIHRTNRQPKSGPKSTNYNFLSMVPLFSPIKKIKLSRSVCHALVYKYSQQPKLILVVQSNNMVDRLRCKIHSVLKHYF